MKEWLILATNAAVDVIDWLALILIVVGAVEAFFRGVWTMFASPDGHHERDVWLRFGRWLVAGLTFQLAADVLETAITTSWDEVARLAAIAAIRTFLNYFLERDIGEVRRRQDARPALSLSAPARRQRAVDVLAPIRELDRRLVPRKGLEPSRLAPLVPETSASTNSATWAWAAS